jgi:hypothetical protein
MKLPNLMAAMLETEDEAPSPHPIDERAQAMELRDRYRRASVSAQLEPGMLCREKRGMGFLKRSPLVMFWRWLDPANEQDAAIIDHNVRERTMHQVDCYIGFIDGDGDLCFTAGESWRLEPCGEFPDE